MFTRQTQSSGLQQNSSCSLDAPPSRLTATIARVEELTDLSRSEIYRLLAAEKLRAVKSGSRTLIVWASVEEHLDSLPPATFRPARAA